MHFIDSHDSRWVAIQTWLAQLPLLQSHQWQPLAVASADASFRRYFRLVRADGQHSFIVMDSPPALEDMTPFVHWANALRALDIRVPQIYAQEDEAGFLLLDDFGQTTFWQAAEQLKHDAKQINCLYRQALHDLADLQILTRARLEQWQAQGVLQPYSAERFANEMALFSDWLVAEFCQQIWTPAQHQAWLAIMQQLIERAMAQPQVWVHRDYHSRNLMVTAGLDRLAQTDVTGESIELGLLDFQDAVLGPLTYDAVSLLRDCYIDWPPAQQQAWLADYYQCLAPHFGTSSGMDLPSWPSFVQDFDWMGVQRHLKAAGIFARLYLRDAKPGYLPALPRTLNYLIQQANNYPELTDLVDLVEPVLAYCKASPLCVR